MKKSYMQKLKRLLFVIFFMAFLGPVYADEVTDSIHEALTQYKSGEYAAAVENLNYASQLISQKKGDQLQTFLPDPLPGWTAEEASSQAIGAAMFGGGVSAERQYMKDASSVKVTIVTDSPVVQSMMMLFTSPMFAASEGGKLEKISGYKAIVNYKAGNKQGDIKIMVANRFLVTVEGNTITKEELRSYAKSINYKKLACLP